MSKRALLIVNRKSRSGAGGAAIDAAVEQLKHCGLELVGEAPDDGQQIGELIRRHRNDADCVIVGGGDGSMNAAAAALVETRLPLGVLPMGTANDLARTLHIPLDIEQACAIITGGVLHQIDLGRVNEHYFFNVAHIGLGVHVTQQLSPAMKQRWGVFSYAHSLWRAIRTFHAFHADIVCDGRRRRVRSMQIAVGNGRHYGGGMTVAQEASIDDHRFFLYSMEPRNWWELIRMAPAVRTGRFDARDPVDIDHGRHIEIITRRSMPVVADGEALTHTPAHFDMAAGAVNVFVPAYYFDKQQELRDAVQR